MKNKRIVIIVSVIVIVLVAAFVYEYVKQDNTIEKEKTVYEEAQKNAENNSKEIEKKAKVLVDANAEADLEGAEETQTIFVQEQYGLYPGEYIAQENCDTFADMDTEQKSGLLKKGDIVEVTNLASSQDGTVYGQIQVDGKRVWVVVQDKENKYFLAKS